MIVKVVVDAPLPAALEYALPARADGAGLIGSCCVVPLGRRRVSGLIVGTAA
ncbi:MAG: hypothetical protein ACK58P_13610, partial [Betaproteobacteria bacterium]